MRRENMPHDWPRTHFLHTGLLALAFALAAGAALATHPPLAADASTASPKKATKPVPPLDLNTATKVQLKKLAWIGDAEADRIIAARPYLSKADIVANAGIPVGVYQVIKAQIAVYPKTMLHPKS